VARQPPRFDLRVDAPVNGGGNVRDHIVKARPARCGFILGVALISLLAGAGSALAQVPPSGAQNRPAGPNHAAVDKLVADAKAALKNRKTDLAVLYLKNAARLEPANTTVRVELALALLRTGDEPGAKRELRQARKDGAPDNTILPFLLQIMLAGRENQTLLDEFPDPGNASVPAAADILRGRAFALQNLGKPVEAVDAMDRALKLRRDARGLLARSQLAYQQGDVVSAKNFIDQSLQMVPDYVQALMLKIGILAGLKDTAGALSLADRLIAKYPDSLEPKLARIEILLGEKQYAKAKTEVDGLLAKRPKLLIASYYKAVILAQSGDAAGAWVVAVILPQEFLDSSPKIGLTVAQMALSAGHEDKADSILSRVVAHNPAALAARLQLVTIRLNQSSTDSALKLLDPVKDSSDPQTVRLLARAYTDLDRKDDAQKVLKRLGASGDQNAALQHALSELRAGHTEQAITELKGVAAGQPGNIMAVRLLIAALVQARRFPEALAAADRLGQDSKQRATALTLRGGVLLAQRAMPEAQAAFDKAVALEPNNPVLLQARASFLVAAEKYSDASKDLRASLSFDPKNIAPRIRLAEIAARQGNDQEVRKVLGEATALFPQDASPRLALIRYLVTRRDYGAALKGADELVRLQPANAVAVALRGQIQSALQQKPQAVESFRRLVSLTPNAAQAQMLLGDALFLAGDRAGAQRALDAAAKLSPDAPAVKNGQINLQFAIGNADAAVSLARAFQASHPGSQADVLVADTLAKAKHLDQAQDVLVKSFAAKPDRQVLSRLVQIKLATNDRKAAADLMSRWVARNPADTGMRQDLAMVLMGAKDYAAARIQYEAILKQDAGNILAMNNLGWMIQESDPERALSLLTRASTLAPNSAEVVDTLGWFKLRQRKDAVGGLALLQRAHALEPKDGQITYHLAVALDAGAKRDAARTLLKELLASDAKFEDRPAALQLASAWR
jgi:putative PEP-CTERM system TPR-repeat lipoprotein